MNIEDLNVQNNQPNNLNNGNNNPNPVPPTPTEIGPMEGIQPSAPDPMMPQPPTPNPEQTPPIAPQINLQPEGIVPPVQETPQNQNPQPLMGATLTANSNLTGQGMQQPSMNPEPQNNPFGPQPIEQNPFGVPDPSLNPFGQPPMNGGVPTPPSMDPTPSKGGKQKKEKGQKKINTPLLITLILVLLAGVGYGVYYFLNSAKPKASIQPNLSLWEKGETLPQNASDYGIIAGVDASSCTVDNSKIKIDELGKYEYSISCPGIQNPVTGMVDVKDNKGPEVELKELVITPNGSVSLEDFIVSCKDASIENGCTVKQSEEEDPLDEIIATTGTHTLTLIVEDDSENKTVVKATLKVDENAPQSTFSCTSAIESETKATVTENIEYGITAENKIYNVQKIRTYKFETIEDYQEAKNTYESSKKLDGKTGTAKFEEKAKAIILTYSIDLDDLKEELNVENTPETLDEILKIYNSTPEEEDCSLS